MLDPRSQNKLSKSDLNDLDFDIDDLLADTTPREKKTTSKYKPSLPKKKPDLNSDAFYEKLAADAGLEEISDVSEADPNEVAKSLEGLDDMDAGLFAPKKTAPKAQTQSTASTYKPSASKPTAQSKSSADSYLGFDEPQETKPRVKTFKKRSTFDDDDDDPLAGLLSDDEDVPAKPSLMKKATPTSAVSTPSDNSQDSKRLEIERPPTRSGQHTPDKKGGGRGRQDDVMFDDDDVLGGMGLSSPTASKNSVGLGDEAVRPGGAKSVFDDLLGTSSSTVRPSTGDRREFTLDAKYRKPQKKEATADDFSFGSYMPSSAAGGSRPNSRRSVRFEDDQERPKSTPARGSYLESAIENDSRDWLEMASGRPSSEGRSRDAKKTSEPEAVDWLGLSRLGSPDPSGRDGSRFEMDNDSNHSDDYSTGSFQLSHRPSKKSPREKSQSPAGKSPSRSQSPPRSPPRTTPVKGSHTAMQDADDWLGKSRRRSPSPVRDRGVDYSQGHRSRSPPRAKTPLQKQSSLEKTDPQLGTGGGDLKDDEDFLGLGKEVDLDDIVSTKPRSRSPFRKAEDLFSAPPTRNEMRATLPWDTGSSKRQSPPRSAPAAASTPRVRKSSLAESPRGLNDSLDALLEMEKEKNTPSVTAARPAAPSSAAPVVTAMTAPTMNADFERQLSQQQATLNKQQSAAQQQFEQQQRLLQQQQQQQVEAMHRQQQQLLDQQKNMIMQPGMPVGGFGLLSQDYESRIKKLEMEKGHAEMMMETMRTQHAEQVKLLEDSYQRRIELMETGFKSREERLKEENELLSRESMDKLRALEKDRSELITNHLKKQQQLEDNKRHEVDTVRTQYRQTLEDVHREHDEALERLKRVKDQEMDAVVNRHSHSKTMSTVMERVGESVRELESLHTQVESSHLNSLSERERSALDRDHQLKGLQERLEQQSHDNAQERARLQALVTKLELQLTEQTRDMEQERWRLRQEESRLRSLQETLEQEKTTLMGGVAKERAHLEKAKDRLLEEQKSVLQQIHEERTALSEERAQFTVTRQLALDENTRVTSKNSRAEIEVESTVKAINNEKERLSEMRADAAREKGRLEEERARVKQERDLLRVEEQKLESLAITVKERSQEMQDMVTSAAGAREEGSKALAHSRKLETEHGQRLKKIQAELHTLRDKEKQIAQERLSLAREKQSIEKMRDSMLCVNCSTPVKDAPLASPYASQTQPMQLQESFRQSDRQLQMTTNAQKLFASLPQDMRSDVRSHVTVAIEADRSLRMWKMNAQKDKAYLDEENTFLQALKHAPYHQN